MGCICSYFSTSRVEKYYAEDSVNFDVDSVYPLFKSITDLKVDDFLNTVKHIKARKVDRFFGHSVYHHIVISSLFCNSDESEHNLKSLFVVVKQFRRRFCSVNTPATRNRILIVVKLGVTHDDEVRYGMTYVPDMKAVNKYQNDKCYHLVHDGLTPLELAMLLKEEFCDKQKVGKIDSVINFLKDIMNDETLSIQKRLQSRSDFKLDPKPDSLCRHLSEQKTRSVSKSLIRDHVITIDEQETDGSDQKHCDQLTTNVPETVIEVRHEVSRSKEDKKSDCSCTDQHTEYLTDSFDEELSDVGIYFKECCVCLERECCVVFEPCRHLCTCATCHIAVKNCPLCQAVVTNRIVAFV